MAASVICVIDDDDSTRFAVAGLVRLFGFDARTYNCAEDFLADETAAAPPVRRAANGVHVTMRLKCRASGPDD